MSEQEYDIPDGTYEGTWTGHDLEFDYDGEVFRFHTHRGVRARKVPVTFDVANSFILEQTIAIKVDYDQQDKAGTRPCVLCDRQLEPATPYGWETFQPYGGGELRFIFGFGSTRFDDHLGEGMTFVEASDFVCRELPEGWAIRIELERDAGNIVLENPFCETEDFPANHECFEQTLRDAVEHAISEDAFYVRGPNPGELRDSRWKNGAGT